MESFGEMKLRKRETPRKITIIPTLHTIIDPQMTPRIEIRTIIDTDERHKHSYAGAAMIWCRGFQPAARGPPAALRRVLYGPGRVFHKIKCVMNIEA